MFQDFVKDKLLVALTLLLMGTGMGTLTWVCMSYFKRANQMGDLGHTSCVQRQVNEHVRDTHMTGLADKGSIVKVLIGYYICNPVTRGDIVSFRISPSIPPAPRIVYGLPGDRFEVLETEYEGQWNLRINGSVIMAGDRPYHIESRHQPPLKTYELSRKGILGKNEYIILSHVPPGMSDSSNLGIIRKKAFEGKVLLR